MYKAYDLKMISDWLNHEVCQLVTQNYSPQVGQLPKKEEVLTAYKESDLKAKRI